MMRHAPVWLSDRFLEAPPGGNLLTSIVDCPLGSRASRSLAPWSTAAHMTLLRHGRVRHTMKKLLVLLLLGGIVAGAVIYGPPVISQYDELVRLQEDTHREWAQVDVLLVRRYELIPRLVATV